MKKGFTLIELLAVIVILAIIALIASPIVIGLINDAKVQSAERSCEAIISAAKNKYATNILAGTSASTGLISALDLDNKPSGTLYWTLNATTNAVTVSATSGGTTAANISINGVTCTINASAISCS